MSTSSQPVKDLIHQARKELLVNKDCKKAGSYIVSLLESEAVDEKENLLIKNTIGLIYLEKKEYQKAAEIYKEIDEKYQAGYCELLMGNEEDARKLWYSAPDSEPCEWGKSLLDFIHLKRAKRPTFLQIRNHLETDIGYFIQADKLKYAENLIKNDDVFISVNLEAYKLIGRTLLNHGFYNMARKYLLKSLQILPDESETLYFLGRYNYLIGAYGESKKVIEKCLENNPNYTPAKDLLTRIEMNLHKLW